MAIEHHSLINEFPEFKDDIHALKLSDAHFKKLWDEYNHLTHEIEKMEQEIVPSTTFEEEKLKKQRLQLKDTLFGYLKKESQARAS
ncbi:YdcH family protein [Marinomonas transparens]|uniref:YdcH family protein n=1 Tax=Marinomonas transparens TaxID=2795388 RepID=A0A934JKA8_9GAMM|nr:YdcH family protein [Marinomonas transparens]MBJ7537376.1 YdcH family protein [Marinomonas transparens]